MRRLAWWSCLLLVSCTTLNGNGLPPALAPFVEASRFVPDGMLSFAFLTGTGMWFQGCQREIWAARDFELPDKPGIGLSRSIYIGDFGEKGVKAEDLGVVADDERIEIDAHTCWHSTPDPQSHTEQHDSWLAIVDGRYALLAHHRDVLAEALRRAGDPGTLLASFGDLSFVPTDATELIFNLPRTGEVRRWARPSPTAAMVVTVSPAPWRLAVFSRAELDPDCREVLSGAWTTANPPAYRVGPWRCQSERLRWQGALHEDTHGLLVLWQLFGFWVFI